MCAVDALVCAQVINAAKYFLYISHKILTIRLSNTASLPIQKVTNSRVFLSIVIYLFSIQNLCGCKGNKNILYMQIF